MAWAKAMRAGAYRSLSDAERDVLAVLVAFASDNGIAYPSGATIARVSGRARETIFRALKRLEAVGLITRRGRLKRQGVRAAGPIIYTVTPMCTSGITHSQSMCTSPVTGDVGLPGVVTGDVHNRLSERHPERQPPTPCDPQGAGSLAIAQTEAGGNGHGQTHQMLTAEQFDRAMALQKWFVDNSTPSRCWDSLSWLKWGIAYVACHGTTWETAEMAEVCLDAIDVVRGDWLRKEITNPPGYARAILDRRILERDQQVKLTEHEAHKRERPVIGERLAEAYRREVKSHEGDR